MYKITEPSRLITSMALILCIWGYNISKVLIHSNPISFAKLQGTAFPTIVDIEPPILVPG